ncbi:helix-hairpin-helix domain-containing protein [Aliarcobacter butzleri]|uniref:helix-hairpin-helix domain-containing protein n=1 Tax=Aliarcobacter butzleri TaxID=28197 RepID=UPI00125F6C68|nr:helix-hairpin-helix domain-containing protein [Aliarcobacter butzleri]
MLNFIKNLFIKPKQKSFINSGNTIGEMQNKSLEDWGDEDIIDGFEFVATLQLRTPLEILRHHGEIFKEKNQTPPNYAKEQWQGIWIPKTKSYKDLGFDIEEIENDNSSSDIGYVKSSEYVKFLIDFRKIVESDNSNDEMQKELFSLAEKNQKYKSFWAKHKKTDKDFPHSFFYKQLTKIDGIGIKTAKLLYENGIKTINDLKNAHDDELLKIKGIGNIQLKKIRND